MSLSQSMGTQDWRAVACLAPAGERLLCVGESSSQVRAAYIGAWGEVIRDEDRPTVRAISLQKWAGRIWAGQWEHQQYLAVPNTHRGKSKQADEPVAESAELTEMEEPIEATEPEPIGPAETIESTESTNAED